MVGVGRASRGLGEDQRPQHFDSLEQLPCSDRENRLRAHTPPNPAHLPQLCHRPLCSLVRPPPLLATQEFLLTQWLQAKLAHSDESTSLG